jgi:hypothetical protein
MSSKRIKIEYLHFMNTNLCYFHKYTKYMLHTNGLSFTSYRKGLLHFKIEDKLKYCLFILENSNYIIP